MIDEAALTLDYVRSSGPGGQNVNKVSTAAQLRYDLHAARHPDAMKARAAALAGSRLTNDGVIVMHADRFRTQAANRQDALDRLEELLAEAAKRPVPRRPTKPSRAAKARRVDGKVLRGSIKANRRPVRPD